MIDAKKPILVISDLQIPFEHKKALSFCRDLKRQYKIPNENILNVGDETDQYHASDYPKDPDAELSPFNEFAITRERIRQWGSEFPLMKLCTSNHGLRWLKKATGAMIPSQVIRSYQDLFETPGGWQWRDEWRFTKLRHPFRMIHGSGYSGKDGHRNAAIDGQISTIIGHLHSHAAVSWIETAGGARMWAVNTGCLIRIDAVAFKYDKLNRIRPQLGATVIVDGGRMPIFHPLF